jgi:SAM-dependent methyltransferase
MPSPLFQGTGPGAVAKDGCSVELYARLAYVGELECLAPLLTPGTTVLELGCGAGRLTRRLLSFGCVVTAIDNCADMLSHAPAEAHLVCADIEGLQLAQTFDVVLLASGLINHFDPAVRSAFVSAAAAHLKPVGQVVLQRHDAGWLEAARAGPVSEFDGIQVEVASVERDGGVISMTVAYQEGCRRWTHSFAVVALDQPKLQQLLHEAGFGELIWLDAAQRWARASLDAEHSGPSQDRRESIQKSPGAPRTMR